MASTAPADGPKDVTFRSYSDNQAATYAKHRLGYPPAFIQHIVDHHRSTGGTTDVLLDVGCGPGNATRAMSSHFDVAFGADPGEAMLKTASEIGGTSSSGKPIQYRLCPAEEIDTIKDLEHGSVDMITAATAAHWFEMPKFWAAAGKLLRPGGTVALWTVYRDRETQPNTPVAVKLFNIMKQFHDEVTAPYDTPGNRLAGSGYVGLVMPWDEAATTPLFEKETFLRQVFTAASGLVYGSELVTAHTPEDFIKRVEATMATTGSVTRWRQANPDLVGTDKDCLQILSTQLREAFDSAEGPVDFQSLVGALGLVLLLVKRSKSDGLS